MALQRGRVSAGVGAGRAKLRWPWAVGEARRLPVRLLLRVALGVEARALLGGSPCVVSGFVRQPSSFVELGLCRLDLVVGGVGVRKRTCLGRCLGRGFGRRHLFLEKQARRGHVTLEDLVQMGEILALFCSLGDFLLEPGLLLLPGLGGIAARSLAAFPRALCSRCHACGRETTG